MATGFWNAEPLSKNANGKAVLIWSAESTAYIEAMETATVTVAGLSNNRVDARMAEALRKFGPSVGGGLQGTSGLLKTIVIDPPSSL